MFSLWLHAFSLWTSPFLQGFSSFDFCLFWFLVSTSLVCLCWWVHLQSLVSFTLMTVLNLDFRHGRSGDISGTLDVRGDITSPDCLLVCPSGCMFCQLHTRLLYHQTLDWSSPHIIFKHILCLFIAPNVCHIDPLSHVRLCCIVYNTAHEM